MKIFEEIMDKIGDGNFWTIRRSYIFVATGIKLGFSALYSFYRMFHYLLPRFYYFSQIVSLSESLI